MHWRNFDNYLLFWHAPVISLKVTPYRSCQKTRNNNYQNLLPIGLCPWVPLIMSNRTWVRVNDALIIVNSRHTLSQKSREAIMYNKSCLQASFKIEVRLKFYVFLKQLWLPWLSRKQNVSKHLPITIFIWPKRCDKNFVTTGNNSFTMFCSLISLGLKWKWHGCIKRPSQREVS